MFDTKEDIYFKLNSWENTHQLGTKSKYLKKMLNLDSWLLDLSFVIITLQLLAFPPLPIHSAATELPSPNSFLEGSFPAFLPLLGQSKYSG